MSGLLQGALAPLTSAYPTFRTIPVPPYKPALYTLSIRSPGFAAAPYSVYTFPMSPASVHKTYTAMSAMYDTAGTPAQLGVQREMDIFGNSPVIYTLEGTTGWQRHSNDAYAWTGQQSIQNLQYLLNLYAQLNQEQMQSGIQSLYTLEFYDYFNNEFWQVEPIGEQGIFQDAGQPLWQRYRFTLPGIKRVDAPIFSSLADPIGQLLNRGSASLMSQVSGSITSTLSSLGL